jgi:hypothetical protein
LITRPSHAIVASTAAPTPNPDGSTPAGSLDVAKGSTLLRLVRRVIFAARPRAGAEARVERGTTMTVQRDLKRIIRVRQQKTGESYTAARAQVMRGRDEWSGNEPEPPVATVPVRADAAVLKVNQQCPKTRAHCLTPLPDDGS